MQAGIGVREALRAGRWQAAAAGAAGLDQAHLIELLLGAALQDGRDGFAAARVFVGAWDGAGGDPGAADPGGRWAGVCRLLCGIGVGDPGEPDRRLDRRAAAWVAAGVAPERWQPGGRAPSAEAEALRRAILAGGAGAVQAGGAPSPDPAPCGIVEGGPASGLDGLVAAELAGGASGGALLGWFVGLPLYPAVALYYRAGTIWALGCRPLLVLAQVQQGARGAR